jgi:hypothetical protein
MLYTCSFFGWDGTAICRGKVATLPLSTLESGNRVFSALGPIQESVYTPHPCVSPEGVFSDMGLRF